jgi:tetratricopeptide (TPR) repeat protein
LPAGSAEAIQVKARLGDALANAGRGGEAAQAYLAAAHTANAADALELRRRAAEQQLSAGYIDDGLDTLRAVLRAVGMRLAESPRRALASLMARRLRLRLRGLRFTERDPSQIAAETLTRIDICWSASHGLGTIDTIRGADFQVRHLLLALNAGEPFRVSRALAMECMYSAVAGQATWSRTQRLLADARRLAEQIDDDRARGMAMLAEALAEYQAGRYQAAFDCFEAGIAIFSERCTGVAFEIAGCRRFGLDSLFNLGELGELSRRVPQYLREAERRGDLYAAMDMRTGLPNVAWLVAGDPDEAVRQAQEGIERWSQRGFHLQHYYSALAHANAALYRGDSARARACVIDIWPSLRRSLLLRIQALRAEALMLRGRAAAAHALRERDADALSESRTMADKLVKERIPAARPSAALLRASAALWHGDREACMDTLAAAERGFEAADMALMAAVCLRRRGQLMGGDAGRALVERSDAWMRGQSIREPEPMTSLYLIHPDEARPPR